MAEPGPVIVRHLVAAYCVQRTVLLLAGHAIDVDERAIKRLGLWTILSLRWPLLADWLKQHPEAIDGLREGVAPPGAGSEIAAVYALPEANRFGALADGYRLDADAIRSFAIPIDVAPHPGRGRAIGDAWRAVRAPSPENAAEVNPRR